MKEKTTSKVTSSDRQPWRRIGLSKRQLAKAELSCQIVARCGVKACGDAVVERALERYRGYSIIISFSLRLSVQHEIHLERMKEIRQPESEWSSGS